MDLIVNFPQHPLRVLFASHMKVTIIKNLAHEHKTKLWYTDFEMKSFRVDAACLLKSITSNGMTVAQYAKMQVNKTRAFLGLEDCLSTAARREVSKHRCTIVNATISLGCFFHPWNC